MAFFPSAKRLTRVIIVDDDDSLRFLLERDLRLRDPHAEQWQVATAAGPEEGLELVRDADREQPLFVLADYDLKSTKTGAQLLEEVARLRPESTRVLFSGHPRAELELAIGRARPNAFIEKPLRLGGLVDKLVELLSEQTRTAPRVAAPAHPAPAHDAAAGASRHQRQVAVARHAPSVNVTTAKEPVDVYRAMIDSVTDYAIFRLDLEGRVLTWNPGAVRTMGYTQDEVIGKHFSMFFPTAGNASWKPQFEMRVATDEGRFEESAWRVRKDGTVFWANVIMTRIDDENGAPIGFVKVTRDLTDKRHQDEALKQSEERYRLLIEGVRDYAIFMLDPSGRIASWNAGAQRIKGYTADEIMGEHFSRFYTEEDRARNHPQNELRIAIERGVYEEEGWRVRKDGTRFWASVVITALFSTDGQLRGFAKVTRDLTQRRLDEEALRGRAAELSELARELEAFNYTVAHDLRAPLRAVIHLSELLATSKESLSREEEKRLLESVHESAVRMGQLVEDLLALSRATKGSLNIEEVDMSAMARRTAGEVQRRMGATETEVAVEDGLVATADARMLQIVLENLLSNAVKFSRPSPRPRVQVGRASTPWGGAFFVRDNGVGFDESHADRLYRPFERLHGANEFDGTGIGLATVARIVLRHGGRVWAESKPGHGATFYFTLPPQSAVVTETKPPKGTTGPGS